MHEKFMEWATSSEVRPGLLVALLLAVSAVLVRAIVALVGAA